MPMDPLLKSLIRFREWSARKDEYPMQTIRSTKEQISFKQNEVYLQDARDQLGKHYRLNKSDLIKFLIKKEAYILKQPQETWSYQ